MEFSGIVESRIRPEVEAREGLEGWNPGDGGNATPKSMSRPARALRVGMVLVTPGGFAFDVEAREGLEGWNALMKN